MSFYSLLRFWKSDGCTTAALHGFPQAPRLPGSQAPNPKHVKLCFEMPRRPSPDGAIPHTAMPRPDLTSPGPRHGRQGPNNSVHESTKHGRPMSRRRGNLHLWTRESGIRKKPLISNPHLRSYRCTAFVCCSLSTVNFQLCIHSFVLFFFLTTHTTHSHTHTHTSIWVVCLRTSRLHACSSVADMHSPQPSTDSPSWAARSPAALPAARPSSSRRTPMM